MRDLIYLSHIIRNDMPCYGGRKSVSINQVSMISKGDTANTLHISMNNHIGTHVDVPYHFFNDGLKLTDYPPSQWLFNNPQCIDVEVNPGELINYNDVSGQLSNNTDLLLIRTGMEAHRDDEMYWKNSPGISSQFAFELRSNYQNLRAVGMDIISVSSLNHRQEGRLAHRAFLGQTGNFDPILLIEDMSLKNYENNINTVIVAPLFIENADGAPCTVVGLCNVLDSIKLAASKISSSNVRS